jgi:hypothetical protein
MQDSVDNNWTAVGFDDLFCSALFASHSISVDWAKSMSNISTKEFFFVHD